MITAWADADAAASSNPVAVPWWSFTKTVLAVAALALAEQGRMALDHVHPAGFTTRQLLQHRAGLPEYGALAAYHDAVARGDCPWPLPELLERTEARRLRYLPGSRWAYSNIGYALIRSVVEDAAGQELAAALRRLIFAPLGLDNARVVATQDDLRGCWGVAAGYDPGWVYHGLIIGPAAEAARLLHAILAGRLLTRPSIETMQETVELGGLLPERPWRTTGYGLGLMIGTGLRGDRFVGHTGGGPGSTCAVYASHAGRVGAAFSADTNGGITEETAMRMAATGA